MAEEQWSWTIKENIELLAWIDFCKQQKLEPKKETLRFMVLFRDAPSCNAVEENLAKLWQRYNNQSEVSEETMSLADMLSKGSAYMTRLPGEMHAAIRTRVDQHSSNPGSLDITRVMKKLEERNQEATGPTGDFSLAEGNQRGVKRCQQVERVSESLPLSKKPRSSKVSKLGFRRKVLFNWLIG